MYEPFACQQMPLGPSEAWSVDGEKRKTVNKLGHCNQLGCLWCRASSVRRPIRWKCSQKIYVLVAKERTRAVVTRVDHWHLTLVADSCLLVCYHGAVLIVVRLANQLSIRLLSTTRSLFMQLYTTTIKLVMSRSKPSRLTK